MLRTVKRIMRLSGKYRGKLILSFIAGFLENSMAAVAMFGIYIGLRWSVADAPITTRHILWVALVLAASLILRFVFKLLEYRLQSGVGYEIVCDKRLALGEKLRRLSMGFYNETDAGNISSVVNNDLVFVESFAMSFLSKTVGAVAGAALIIAGLMARGTTEIGGVEHIERGYENIAAKLSGLGATIGCFEEGEDTAYARACG